MEMAVNLDYKINWTNSAYHAQPNLPKLMSGTELILQIVKTKTSSVSFYVNTIPE